VSRRLPATDDQGRPIVAELGRPETPEELADRRAESSRRHRANQTLLNLLLAIGASLAIVAVLVLVVVRPGPSDDANRVDYRHTAAQAHAVVSTPLAAPELPAGWWANRAELSRPSDQVASWQIGFISPASRYVGLVQGIDADPTWVADQVAKLQPTGSHRYGGLTWRVYDHRDAGGDVAYALVTTSGRSTIVLAGSTATDAEFATVATAIGRDLT